VFRQRQDEQEAIFGDIFQQKAEPQQRNIAIIIAILIRRSYFLRAPLVVRTEFA